MTTSSTPSGRRTGIIAAVLAAGTTIVLALPGSPAQAAIPGADPDGMVCEPTSGVNPHFDLDARTGYITTPDGNSIFMWSYTATGRGFQLPGPTLCVTSGETVSVTLHNSLPEPTSIIFPGQGDVTEQLPGAGVQPVQPELDGTGAVVSLVQSAGNGGSVTYTFRAGSPGTYLYQSGTEVTKQREMGLYGALVVRPAGAAGQANARPETVFSKEFLLLVSQLDPDWHRAVERGRPIDTSSNTPRYFLINGRSMPDTLAPNNAAWLPGQPYSGLVHITADRSQSELTATGGTNHAPALIRYLNAGPQHYPFHPHGSSQKIVTRDGADQVDATGADASYDRFLLDVGPGQSVDALERWTKEFDPDTNPLPSDIQLPQLQDQIVGPGTETWFSENPYLGGAKGEVPTGIVQNNVCGEYYHVAHSHALQQATNFGASFGGMMTLIRIDPPLLWNCQSGDYGGAQ